MSAALRFTVPARAETPTLRSASVTTLPAPSMSIAPVTQDARAFTARPTLLPRSPLAHTPAPRVSYGKEGGADVVAAPNAVPASEAAQLLASMRMTVALLESLLRGGSSVRARRAMDELRANIDRLERCTPRGESEKSSGMTRGRR